MAHASIITANTTRPVFSMAAAISSIATMRETSKQRRALAKLTETQLTDIGMTPAQRTAECNLRFWQSAV